jgi:hypothetical protein
MNIQQRRIGKVFYFSCSPIITSLLQEEKALKAAEEPVMTAELLEEERKKEEAEQRRRMDQQYQKLVAYLWRMEQETAKVATETADEYLARLARKEKSQCSNSSKNLQLMAEQRQQRDREWLEQRRRQLLTRQQQQQPPKVASLRRAVSVPRDPQRVLRPTSAFMARLLPFTSDDAVPSSSSTAKRRPADSYILDIQSKSVFLVKNPLLFPVVFILWKVLKYRAILFKRQMPIVSTQNKCLKKKLNLSAFVKSIGYAALWVILT